MTDIDGRIIGIGIFAALLWINHSANIRAHDTAVEACERPYSQAAMDPAIDLQRFKLDVQIRDRCLADIDDVEKSGNWLDRAARR
jgi:hypothetical protein